MKFLNHLTVGQRQQTLAIMGALMLCLCVAVGLGGIRLLADSSEKAFVAKDVVADILPPPLYLIEARLKLSMAAEVRQLALRASSAAEDIRRQVEATRQAVANGSAGSESAGLALQDMAGIIHRMAQRVDGIWETTFAQTSGINMLVETVGELTHSAEAHATMVAQTASVAAELQVSAAELDEVVSCFTLGGRKAGPVVSAG